MVAKKTAPAKKSVAKKATPAKKVAAAPKPAAGVPEHIADALPADQIGRAADGSYANSDYAAEQDRNKAE